MFGYLAKCHFLNKEFLVLEKVCIEIEFRKKYPDKFMPAHCVPTKDVIKYFDIDIGFLKSLASIDLEDTNT